MNDRLTVEEIRARFDSEWVLLGEVDADPTPHVRGGKVLFHSKDRDEVYEQAIIMRPGRFAILYTGTMPADMAILL
jgi:hypothetical protein